MAKWVRIICEIPLTGEFFSDEVLRRARSLELEGYAQNLSGSEFKIVVGGQKDSVEDFLDIFYESAARGQVKNLAIEPFLKDGDYRGVFRVVK